MNNILLFQTKQIQKVINLEAKLGNSKYPLSDPSHPSESSKTIQQEDLPLKQKKALI